MATATTPRAAFLDLFNPSFHHHASEVAAARELHWYARTPIGVAVLRYAECAELLPDPRLQQGVLGFLAAQGVTTGPAVELVRDAMTGVEGERHRRLRQLVSRAFTPRAVESMRPVARDVTNRLIDEFIHTGECEFMAEFANRMPSAVTMQMFGIPSELHAACSAYVADLGALFSLDLPAQLARVEAAIAALDATAADLIGARRRRPGDDLISALIAAESEGDKLTTRELRVLVANLLFAAQDTTRNQLGLAMATFAAHLDQWAMLAADPALGPAAVEEVLRVNPTVPFHTRVAAVDFDHRDLHVPAGGVVTFLAAAANTDPRIFGIGGFDITASRPVRQLSFGAGPHACVGMALARLELAEALPILASRLGPIRMRREPQWLPPTMLYGPVSLPLAWAAPSN